MAGAYKFDENFVTVTEFRHNLSELGRFGQKNWDDALPVEVITERGKPVATVMPYEAYEDLRELMFLLRAHDNLANERIVASFKAGTSVEDALASITSKTSPKGTRVTLKSTSKTLPKGTRARSRGTSKTSPKGTRVTLKGTSKTPPKGTRARSSAARG